MTASFSAQHRHMVIFISGLVTGMGLIDATALNVALPFIQSSLNAPATDIHWVLEIYLLFLAALMMAGGAFGDSFGRRRSLRLGIVGFMLTSIGCAFSQTTETLIFWRAFQGISCAVMIPASLALIYAGFPPSERGVAIARWATIVALAIPLGPLVGGLAVDFLSWRYVFLLNVPLCIICLGLLVFLPRPPFEPSEPRPLDIPGSVMITSALGLLTFALLEAGRDGAFTSSQITLLGAGLLLLVGFFWLQMRLDAPMLPTFLMRDRRFVLVCLQTFVLFAGFQSAMYFFSFLLIQSYSYSALQAGAASLPISVIVALISARAGRFVTRHGPRGILFSSAALLGIASLWLSLTTGDYFVSVFPGMVLMGLGVGLFAAPLTTVAMAAAGPGRDGLASGVSNAVSRIGPLLGIAVFGYWIGVDYTQNLISALDESSLPVAFQNYLTAQKSMMAAITFPEIWPQEAVREATEIVRRLFADAVRVVLQISAFLAFGAAGLALFYRCDDAREKGKSDE